MRGSAGLVVVLIGLALVPMSLASATTLGGLAPRTLDGFGQAGSSGAPAVLGCDGFGRAATTGSALASRPVQLPASCGNVAWVVHFGTWSITSGRLAAATAHATATLPVGQTDMAAEATVVNANASGAISGVAINHTGGTRLFLAAVFTGGTGVQLRIVNGTTVTSLASGTASVTSTSVIRVRRSGATVTLSVNGVVALTHTLSASRVTQLAGGTRSGLYWAAGSTVRFTDFLAAAP